MELPVRPIRRFVLILDDPDETIENGVVMKRDIWGVHMDYFVVRVGTEERCDFGPGDRVILSSPDIGRKVKIDGIVYRVVRVSDILAVIE